MSSIKRVMIDIEALGVSPYGAVVQVGAVEFTLAGPREGGFVANISFPSALGIGEVSAETLEWWFQQKEGAIRGLFRYPVDARIAYQEFFRWFCDRENPHRTECWAHANFDHVLLGNAMERAGVRVPWLRKNARDLRTLLALSKPDAIEREGVHHNALDDARHQARLAASSLRKLKEGS